MTTIKANGLAAVPGNEAYIFCGECSDWRTGQPERATYQFRYHTIVEG